MERLNAHHHSHARWDHSHPDRQAVDLAARLFPIEVRHLDPPGRSTLKDPDDEAPHWLQCLFDPGVTLQPIRRLMPGLEHFRTMDE